jgi:hypothetical protein
MIIETGVLIALIVKALAAVPIVTAVTVLVLNFTQIIDWFKELRPKNPQVDKSKLYFTLKDLWASGNYRTIQGVFDTRTQQLGKVRSIRSANVDARLADYHRNHRLVTYE